MSEDEESDSDGGAIQNNGGERDTGESGEEEREDEDDYNEEEEQNISAPELECNLAGHGLGDAEQGVQAALPPAPAAVTLPAVHAPRRQVRQVDGLHGGEQVTLAEWLDRLRREQIRRFSRTLLMCCHLM